MQRRAAAVSAVVLLLVATGAYVFVGFAEEPNLEFEADNSLGVGQSVTEGDRTYDLAALDAAAGGVEATFEWTNDSVRYTATLENNSTVAYQDEERRVLIPNETDPTTFDLEELQNVSAILAADPDVENSTLRGDDGVRYVRYANGTTQPLDEYLPAPARATVAEGDQFAYQNNSTTVASVAPETVTLAWTGERTNAVSVTEGNNATLGDTTYLAHFPDNSTIVLSTDFAGYENSLDRQEYFAERVAGLWGVTILSSLAGFLLLLMAYLPSRY